MPYNGYVESYCDVCGHVVHGGSPVLDGTPENHGLIFCCSDCQKMHTEDVEENKEWYKDRKGENVPYAPHRESYRHFCFGCKNFVNLEPDSPRRGVWYNHVCHISGDITGVRIWSAVDERFEYCRETIKKCFKHREPIKVKISRFDLMDFE